MRANARPIALDLFSIQFINEQRDEARGMDGQRKGERARAQSGRGRKQMKIKIKTTTVMEDYLIGPADGGARIARGAAVELGQGAQ